MSLEYHNKNYQKSLIKPQSRNQVKKESFKFEKYGYHKLIKKYNIKPKDFLINIINDIIYNEKTHLVAVFKDYLIYDDNSEFFKRYYKNYESVRRLSKFIEYYNIYSKIYPNYTSIPECRYLYKNIQKKQRMIDIQEQIENKTIDNSSHTFNKERNEVFSTDVFDSIFNVTNKEDIEILFNIKRDNYKIDDQNFYQKINDIINIIEKFEKKNKKTSNNFNIDGISSYSNKISRRISNDNIKSPLNLGNNILKRYISNSVTNLYRNNSSNFTKISSKWIHSNNKLLNIYSKKNVSKDRNNESNIPNTERSLIEKLEYNLLKLTKKNLMFTKRNYNSSHKMRATSRREYSTFSKHNISTYSKTKNSSSINLNNYTYHKSNSNNNISQNINNPLNYRFGKINPVISSNENYIKSPLTARNTFKKSISNLRSNNINISSSNINNSKSKIIDQHKNKIKLNKENINYKKFNCKNIIYVIKKNSKLSPNITFFNDNIGRLKFSSKNKNINQKDKKKNDSNCNLNNKKNSLKENNKLNKNNKAKIKKRNKTSMINSGSVNNNLLMTTRDIDNKDLNILRNAFKSKLGKKEINNKSLIDFNTTKNYHETIKNNLRNFMSRNKNDGKNNNNESSENKRSKNELFTKLGFLDNFKIKKKIKNEIEKNISKKQNSNSKKPKSKEKIKNY